MHTDLTSAFPTKIHISKGSLFKCIADHYSRAWKTLQNPANLIDRFGTDFDQYAILHYEIHMHGWRIDS